MSQNEMSQDEKYLDLLAIFHYVLGGVLALFSCFPMIHVAVGIAFIVGAFDGQPNPPPPFFGWFFVIIGSCFILAGWTLSCLIIVAGRKLHRRKSHTFCIVIAGLECAFMPFGTVLGVFTIIVLTKEPVRRLFLGGQDQSPFRGESPVESQ